MKKLLVILMAVLMSATMMTACTQTEDDAVVDGQNDVFEEQEKDDPEAETEVDVEAEAETEVEETAEEPANDAEYYASVAEFIEAYPELAQTVEESLGDGINVEIEARENKMVYIYSSSDFDEIFAQAEGMTDLVEEIFDEVFANIVPSLGKALLDMQTEIPSMEAIVVEVVTTEGDVIYQKEVLPEDGEAFEEGDIEVADVADGITLEQYAELLGGTNVYDNEAFAVSIEARENKLVFVYTLNEQIDVTDEMVQGISASFGEMEESIKGIFDSIKTQIPTLEAVVYEYRNADGTFISDCEFKN